MKLTKRQSKTLWRWLTLFGKRKPTKCRYLKMYGGFKLQFIWDDDKQTRYQFELQMPHSSIDMTDVKNGSIFTVKTYEDEDGRHDVTLEEE